MSRVIAHRYAQALFELANNRQILDQVEHELSVVKQIISENVDLRKVLAHPRVEKQEKKKLLENLFAKSLKEETLHFLFLLIDRRRETYIREVADEFTKLANEARGVADATIISSQPLSEEQQNDIAERFGKQLNKTIRLTTKVDPAIIGGLVIRIGDRLYDGSVAGKLQQFQQELKHS